MPLESGGVATKAEKREGWRWRSGLVAGGCLLGAELRERGGGQRQVDAGGSHQQRQHVELDEEPTGVVGRPRVQGLLLKSEPAQTVGK